MAAAITSRHFDLHHGDNIELCSENRLATRKRGFDHGLCAMEMPLVNEMPLQPLGNSGKPVAHVSLLVTRTETRWNGGLSAQSSQNPSSAGLLASAVSAGRGWAFAQVPQTALEAGTLTTVWLDLSARELCYAVTQANRRNVLEAGAEGDAQKGEVPLDDPAILDCLDAKLPLWLYVYIYGALTTSLDSRFAAKSWIILEYFAIIQRNTLHHFYF